MNVVELASTAVIQKAHAYIEEKRVRVTKVSPGIVEAEVKGSGPDPYLVKASAITGIWSCTCPARVVVCAHIAAVGLVAEPSSPPAGTAPTFSGNPPGDDDLDDLFKGLQ